MILYKYFPPARIDVLRRKAIRFTQPAEFNDPFEFNPQICEEPHPIVNLDPALSGLITKYSLRTTIGVLCLSEICDSLLMWDHYAECHRGFVVGFDSNHDFFWRSRRERTGFGHLQKIIYQRQRPIAQWSDITAVKWFQTKCEHWGYEKEWRMARALTDADFRIEAPQFPICLFRFPPEAVLEIILGMQAPTSMCEEIGSLMADFPAAVLLTAMEHPSDYALVIGRPARGC
jgi:hypothetical protein